jgi:hypothetical protein
MSNQYHQYKGADEPKIEIIILIKSLLNEPIAHLREASPINHITVNRE